MHSKIKVENIFIENTNGKILFVLTCQIVVGCVQVGSNVSFPFSAGLDMIVPIDEVEVIGGQRIRVKVHCEDQEEMDFLLGLNLDEEVLLVE
ncbi:hypothetical protein [Janthinobacterium fluminis]|uniref:PilZ domain-containing protein n=1 Tax=Janthinobacterium fluminis TaxID=2987524 RepID=A0ABT5JY79_9BURK|nr:hypothetical protein [Janthinobacterium fluminis]MDC8757108.1 hypothetical protein [Janthinobacterium fluminis]